MDIYNYEYSGSFFNTLNLWRNLDTHKSPCSKSISWCQKVTHTLFITLILWQKIDRTWRYEIQDFICSEALLYFGLKFYIKRKCSLTIRVLHHMETSQLIWRANQMTDFNMMGNVTPVFYKQSIFDPRPENCLSFSKKSPPKIV